ncbi:hypothetical protein RRG08_012914 [Elysia crispata]|uniref:Uncharacterized protein n=2 Tax=Elysia crispata TaxID=231223 RepID=A0AAE1A567_9GAST|nr:hypothetical protein RRG08_012914 [Elysia crispata]
MEDPKSSRGIRRSGFSGSIFRNLLHQSRDQVRCLLSVSLQKLDLLYRALIELKLLKEYTAYAREINTEIWMST